MRPDRPPRRSCKIRTRGTPKKNLTPSRSTDVASTKRSIHRNDSLRVVPRVPGRFLQRIASLLAGAVFILIPDPPTSPKSADTGFSSSYSSSSSSSSSRFAFGRSFWLSIARFLAALDHPLRCVIVRRLSAWLSAIGYRSSA